MPFFRRRSNRAQAVVEERATPTISKGDSEFAYWQVQKDNEGTLFNRHYERFFTTHFDLGHDFYAGKRVLDIGCGPRGSLTWATTAALRVGVDPLAGRYRDLGTESQPMSYVASGAEALPFADGSFDIVSALNSLDHVDELDRSIAEIKRVVKPGGTFLLMADIHHHLPTVNEPSPFSWDVIARFEPELTPIAEHHFEKGTEGMYQSIEAGIPYDHDAQKDRYGVLVARFER